jgi:hypothetical protein
MKRLIALVLITMLIGVAAALAVTPAPHIAAWIEAESRGLIHGDPAYYYNGQASQAEINHAILTAILTMDLQHITGLSPVDACEPGDYVAHQTTDEYMYVYATSSPPPDPGYTRAVGFDRTGALLYLNDPPPIGTYGPAEFHVLCHG